MRTGGTRHPTADGVFRSHERGVSDRLPRASSCCDIRDTASSGVVKVAPYGERLLLMWSVACVLSPWIEGTWGNRPREQNRHTESAPRNPGIPNAASAINVLDLQNGDRLWFRFQVTVSLLLYS